MECQLVELDLAARVLGASVEQLVSLCAAVGARPKEALGALFIERHALDHIYRVLYAPYKTPEVSRQEP